MESPNGAIQVTQPSGSSSHHLISEHGRRFDRIDGEIRAVEDRIKELEATMNQISPLIERMDADLYNHGKDGMKTKFDKFTAIQDDRHRENKAKMNLVIGLLALLCSIFMVVLAIRGLTKASKLITDPFHSKIPAITLTAMER